MIFSVDDRPLMVEWKNQKALWFQQKMDGFRVSIVKNGDVIAFGRQTVPDLWPQMMLNDRLYEMVQSLPDQTVLDGELTVPGENASSVSSALANHPEYLDFHAFAVPFFNGVDLRKVQSPVEALQNASSIGVNVVHPFPLDGKITRTLLIENARKTRIEGYVLKSAHYAGWYKLKVNRTVDVVAVELLEGEKRLEGTLGSIVIAIQGVKVGTVGGFSDEERSEIWNNPEKYLHKVLEVEYDSLTTHRQLKFARFVRWRPDKKAAECVLTQIGEE